ncbi:MAG TPA: hypothetical protein VN673_16850, partial [Clostridia bacterium]|nr:hypothetical protein [Clostridia bacterium]
MIALPRRYAIVPLFMGAIYVTVGQVIELGPFHFTMVRLLIAVGAVRVVLRGERILGGLNGLDKLMVLWAVWAVFSSLFHKKPVNAMVYMLGITYTGLGSYFLIRIFVRDLEEFLMVIKIVIIMLAPVALEMVVEKLTSKNAFSVFGYLTEASNVRHGKIRAQGAFAHAILAGTVGACCMPFAALLWRRHRKLALLGFVVTFTMILTSASSGPILTTIVVLGALGAWKVRSQLRLLIWGCIVGLVALDLVMND